MSKKSGLVAVAVATTLTGCVVTPVEYRPAPLPPESAPPAVTYEPAASYENYSSDEVTEPPPPLPVYEQPPCPVDGYLWTPGLWRWGQEGYFWVPGTWVAPPQVGFLWTPGYWAMAGALFVFHVGYWGPHVGFYGGINYGGGYIGDGYAGGRWVNNNFLYNTAVTNVNVTNVHNTYNQTIINNVTVNNTNITHTSYAGGPGTRTRPTAQEAEAVHEAHMHATPVQVHHETAAQANPELAATRNQGRPPIAATTHPAAFSGPGVIAARPVGPAWHPTASPAAVNAPAHAQPANPTLDPGANPAHGTATHPAQAPAAYRPQAPAAYRPQAPAAYRPQAPAAYRPQAPAAYRPQASAASPPQAPGAYPAHGPATHPAQAPADYRPHAPAATSDHAAAAAAPHAQVQRPAPPAAAKQPANQQAVNGRERPKNAGDRPQDQRD